jgi:hypothetical protein
VGQAPLRSHRRIRRKITWSLGVVAASLVPAVAASGAAATCAWCQPPYSPGVEKYESRILA